MPIVESWPDSIDIVADPQYGIGYEATQPGHIEYGKIRGDDEEFDPSHLLRFSFVLLWGGNNFAHNLPRGGWVVWDKRVVEAADRMMGSPFELAWCKKVNLYKFIRVQHGGAKNADAKNGDVANGKRWHATQKPVLVMSACLDFCSGTVADPYMGSGTTGVAAVRLGRQFYGCEIDPTYFEIAKKRIQAELNRFPLLEGVGTKQTQRNLGIVDG